MSGNERRNYSEEELAILYNQINGLCPLCSGEIIFEKKGKHNKCWNIAHIFPLNPTNVDLEAYATLPKLSDDINDIDNLIMLCPNCHTKYDKPPSKEDYLKLYDLKKRMIENDKIRKEYSSYVIEDEIRDIMKKLSEADFDIPSNINYDLVCVDSKLNSDFNPMLKNKIKMDVSQYYCYVGDLFSELEKIDVTKFNQIATEVKSVFFKFNSLSQNQENIYNHMCDWLSKKTGGGNIEGCKVMIAFFIQNCEVFTIATK